MEKIKEFQIRFNDMDSQSHVNHEAMVSWIAEARISFLDEALELAGCGPHLDYILAHLEMDFIAPVKFPGVVVISTRVEDVGRKSIKLGFEGRWLDKCFINGTSVSVLVETSEGRSVEVPEELRRLLK